MKILLATLGVLAVATYVQGLICLDCTVYSTAYDGYPTEVCFHPNTTTRRETCSNGTDGNVGYCRTKFVIEDGVVTQAERGCVMSDSDHDANTDTVPGDRCTIVQDSRGNPTSRAECYYSCSTDNCNAVSATNVKVCTWDCGSNIYDWSTGWRLHKGACDYITGTCVCNDGWTGVDCGTESDVAPGPSAARKCVQCNSEIYEYCISSTTSVPCAGSEQYCATSITTIYDSSDAVVKTVTVRGCSASSNVVNECFFTNIFTDAPISNVGYNEVTCMSTCDTDGCNTNTANGVIDGSEAKRLYCVQCANVHGCRGQEEKSLCPSGSTHCKSNVTYLMSSKTDLFYASGANTFKLRSVVRACATAPVTPGCTEATFGTVIGVKKYTCTETCQEDGCNIGWPARPKCIQCDATTSNDVCFDTPPLPTGCPQPYHAYCTIIQEGTKRGTGDRILGYPRRITRGCSPVDVSTGCSSVTFRDKEVDYCNYTCRTDGCNVGFAGSGGSSLFQSMVGFVAPVVLGWFAQNNF